MFGYAYYSVMEDGVVWHIIQTIFLQRDTVRSSHGWYSSYDTSRTPCPSASVIGPVKREFVSCETFNFCSPGLQRSQESNRLLEESLVIMNSSLTLQLLGCLLKSWMQ